MITPAIGTTELYKQLQTLLASDTPLFIHGSPGIGKSYIVNDIAKQNGLQIRDVRLSQLYAVDLSSRSPKVRTSITSFEICMQKRSTRYLKIRLRNKTETAPLTTQNCLKALLSKTAETLSCLKK